MWLNLRIQPVKSVPKPSFEDLNFFRNCADISPGAQIPANKSILHVCTCMLVGFVVLVLLVC